MKTFKQWLVEEMSSDTHSIIDGLNRGKHAIMNGHDKIPARVLDMKDIDHLKLSPDQASDMDEKAKKARESGDFFSHSTFGDEKGNRWSVKDVLDHSKSLPVQHLPTSGFVADQVRQHWQGNVERAKKAVPSEQHPILVVKH